MARSAEKVSRSVKEGHGRVPEHREDMLKHPDFANPLLATLRVPSVVDGRSYSLVTLLCVYKLQEALT